MSKFHVVIGIFALGVWFGGLFRGEGTRSAAAQGVELPCATVNGDVDGSQSLQLTDAVRILTTLFVDSSLPLAAICSTDEQLGACQAELRQTKAERDAVKAELGECRAGQKCTLPDTGETKCYNVAGNEIAPCPGAEARAFPGEDGFYDNGCSMEGRFTENHDGTITDSCTGLMWQKMTALPPKNSPHDPEGDGFITWEQALAYCASLGDVPGTDSRFEGAGHTDWRLPNVLELQSLIHYGKEELPHVYGLFNDEPKSEVSFDQLQDGFHVRPSETNQYYEEYWSSTTLTPGIGNQAYAYIVELRYGGATWYDKNGGWYVRAVRGP